MLQTIPEPLLKRYLLLAWLPVALSSASAADLRFSPDSAGIKWTLPQTTRITGRVTDESARPVSNAAVLIAGSERATVSNISGSFEIPDAPVSGLLVIKHPDYETRQVPIESAGSEYVIVLKPRPQLTTSRSKSQYKSLKKDAELAQSGESSSPMRPDRWPYFPGGYKALNRFLANNLNYPAEALAAGIQGSVQISFLLDEDGNISSGRIIKSPGAELEDEALRLVRAMPKWTPAQKEGKPIAVWYTISILFDPEIEKLPLSVKEEVPRLLSKRTRFEPFKAPFMLAESLKKLFQRPAIDFTAHRPAVPFQMHGFVKKPVYKPLQLNFKPAP